LNRRLALFVTALALIATACSPGELAENIIESQEGVGDVEIDESSGEVSIESEDGSMTIGGGEVPDDFPIDLPGGGDVVAVIDAENSSTISLEYGDSFDSIAGFFQDWVDGSGLEVQFKSETNDPETISWSLATDNDEFYSITVGAESGSGKISVLLTTRKGG
jgi:hypothetical protein